MSMESSLYQPVRGTLDVRSPAAGESSEVVLNLEPAATLRSPVTTGGLEFDILDLDGAVVAHGGDGRIFSIIYPVHRPDGTIVLELGKTWRYTRVRVLRPGQAELRLRLGHRQPWSWLTDECGTVVASMLESGTALGAPDGFQLRLSEPALSVVQAVAMAEFAAMRIGALRAQAI